MKPSPPAEKRSKLSPTTGKTYGNDYTKFVFFVFFVR